MKNILKYKQFENNWQIELTEDESELKDNLEFILLDLKDLGIDYSISGRNIYMFPNTMAPNPRWYQNTGVESGFKHYLNIRLRPDYNKIREIINILEDCFNYAENEGWKYSLTIERGINIARIDINSIIELQKRAEYKNNNTNLGSISVFLWKM